MPTISREEGLQILYKTINKNIRHKDYQHTVDHAKFSRQVMTGKGQDELIVSYNLRETAHQKKQRISITNSRTKYASNRVYQVFDKPKRMPRTPNPISYDRERPDWMECMTDRLKMFYAGNSLEILQTVPCIKHL